MLAAAFMLIGSLAVNAPYFAGLTRPESAQVDLSGDGPVILIVVDAMRPDRLTPYGSARNTSPNLQMLADDGVVLSNYFVNGNWTRPSTASLLTGLLPAAHGVEGESDRLAEEYVTIAQMLSTRGVPTGAVVGNGNAGSAFGLSRGFSFYADTVQHWDGLPSADQVVELAVPFVREHAKQRFFLMLFFVDPHDPYHAPAPYENMFVSDPQTPLIRSPHWERTKYSAAQIDRMQATYDGAIAYTDHVLGNFFKTLKDLGVYDKSTIMVTADHGEAFGEHGVFLHSHHLYDEIIRAPLIIRAPNMSKRGTHNAGIFQSIDLMPTIAGLYKVKPTASLPGADILEKLAHPKKSDAERLVVSEFNNFGIHRRMVRDATHKLIYEAPADRKVFRATVGKTGLLPSVSFSEERFWAFDLSHDPAERNNLYSAALLRSGWWKKAANILKTRAPKNNAAGTSRRVAEHIDRETYNDLKALGYVQ